jgi:hypothetical protein
MPLDLMVRDAAPPTALADRHSRPKDGVLLHAVSQEVNHAYDHGAVTVKGQIPEPASAVECAHGIVDRMGDDRAVVDTFVSSRKTSEI